MNRENIREKLASKGLKVTPQRILVLEALLHSREHPTAEMIGEHVRKDNPGISTGTIYNILDTFVENGLVALVRTEKDRMRYDAFLEEHHHLFDMESEKISDYYDEELTGIIRDYLATNTIPGFDIENVKLQISGKYKENQTNQ